MVQGTCPPFIDTLLRSRQKPTQTPPQSSVCPLPGFILEYDDSTEYSFVHRQGVLAPFPPDSTETQQAAWRKQRALEEAAFLACRALIAEIVSGASKEFGKEPMQHAALLACLSAGMQAGSSICKIDGDASMSYLEAKHGSRPIAETVDDSFFTTFALERGNKSFQVFNPADGKWFAPAAAAVGANEASSSSSSSSSAVAAAAVVEAGSEGPVIITLLGKIGKAVLGITDPRLGSYRIVPTDAATGASGDKRKLSQAVGGSQSYYSLVFFRAIPHVYAELNLKRAAVTLSAASVKLDKDGKLVVAGVSSSSSSSSSASSAFASASSATTTGIFISKDPALNSLGPSLSVYSQYYYQQQQHLAHQMLQQQLEEQAGGNNKKKGKSAYQQYHQQQQQQGVLSGGGGGGGGGGGAVSIGYTSSGYAGYHQQQQKKKQRGFNIFGGTALIRVADHRLLSQDLDGSSSSSAAPLVVAPSLPLPLGSFLQGNGKAAGQQQKGKGGSYNDLFQGSYNPFGSALAEADEEEELDEEDEDKDEDERLSQSKRSNHSSHVLFGSALALNIAHPPKPFQVPRQIKKGTYGSNEDKSNTTGGAGSGSSRGAFSGIAGPQLAGPGVGGASSAAAGAATGSAAAINEDGNNNDEEPSQHQQQQQQQGEENEEGASDVGGGSGNKSQHEEEEQGSFHGSLNSTVDKNGEQTKKRLPENRLHDAEADRADQYDGCDGFFGCYDEYQGDGDDQPSGGGDYDGLDELIEEQG
jgi:hypothetical protein